MPYIDRWMLYAICCMLYAVLYACMLCLAYCIDEILCMSPFQRCIDLILIDLLEQHEIADSIFRVQLRCHTERSN